MPELRWALIGLGLLFLVVLALWEWRKSKRRHFTNVHIEPAAVVEHIERAREPVERQRRVEPSIDGMSAVADDPDITFDVPTIHPVEPVRVALSGATAVDVPSAARFEFSDEEPGAVAIQWPPKESARVLSLRVVHPRGEPLSGRTLRNALDSAGLRHGPQKIYHLVNPEGAVLASVANLVRPGSFDPATMDAQQFRGLSVFSVLPGTLPPAQMLEELTALARSLAQRLGATVHDADGQELNGARLDQLRQSLDQAP